MKKLFLTLFLVLLPAQVWAFGISSMPVGTPVQPYEYKQTLTDAKNSAQVCLDLLTMLEAKPVDLTNDPEGANVLAATNINLRNLAQQACTSAGSGLATLNSKIWQGGFDQFGPQTDPNVPTP